MIRDYSRVLAVAALALLLLGCSTANADEFWKFWGDGKAELDGYALVQPRYGAPRDGTAVMIFVTEDFSDALRVKADPGKHPAADVHPVLKLNFVRDFQTGIYDYNVMTSTFVKTEAAFALDKVSFSSQEWCGHVYEQLLARGDKLIGVEHSYFDGEADANLELPLPEGGVVEEQVPILIRGLRGDFLGAGEKKTVPYLPSALRARLEHFRQSWGEATLTRSQTEKVQSALGKVDAYTVTVEEKRGPTTVWTVEAAPPRRILGWKSSTGESGRLLGSTRLPYWQLHDLGQESYLKQLGLSAARAGNHPAGGR